MASEARAWHDCSASRLLLWHAFQNPSPCRLRLAAPAGGQPRPCFASAHHPISFACCGLTGCLQLSHLSVDCAAQWQPQQASVESDRIRNRERLALRGLDLSVLQQLATAVSSATVWFVQGCAQGLCDEHCLNCAASHVLAALFGLSVNPSQSCPIVFAVGTGHVLPRLRVLRRVWLPLCVRVCAVESWSELTLAAVCCY